MKKARSGTKECRIFLTAGSTCLVESIHQHTLDGTVLISPHAAVELYQSESQGIYQIHLRPSSSWPQSAALQELRNWATSKLSSKVNYTKYSCNTNINLPLVSSWTQWSRICHLWFSNLLLKFVWYKTAWGPFIYYIQTLQSHECLATRSVRDKRRRRRERNHSLQSSNFN